MANGGEIWMLDSANYNTGTVTVAKSVSILAVPGVLGSLVATNGGGALSVAPGGHVVGLRNLSFGGVAGAPAGTFGVRVEGSTVTVEDSVFARLGTTGILAFAFSDVRVSNTTLRDLPGAAISLNASNASITGSRLLGNGVGLNLEMNTAGPARVSISDSQIVRNGEGIKVFSGNSVAGANVIAMRCAIDRNGTGIVATAPSGFAEVAVGYSSLVGNDAGWNLSGTNANFYSMVNNMIVGNGTSTGTKDPLPGT